MTEEGRRLEAARDPGSPWKKWGPYLSERQWGTVREDYSDTGNAWDYFSHDQARSRAYPPAARHRRLRREPLLRRLRGVRQGGAGGHTRPPHPGQSLPRGRHGARAAHTLVPQHVVLGRGGAQARTAPARGPARRRRG